MRAISWQDIARLAALALSLQNVSGGGTSFLNHTELLGGLENPEWFEQNIPFLDLPTDQAQIQEVYYYRWETYREHLVYTGAQYGYMASEFLLPASYGAPYGGINAAAGHHINEGRWLRNLQYGQDVVNYWLNGPGQLNKPATDGNNPDTYDWAHEYSFWAASSVWRQYLVTGDKDFVVGQLDNLVTQYRGWDNHFNDTIGLYWQVPVWDATEYSAASYNSSDPYHGGAGFRPTINGYQYGDAQAIAAIAKLAGNSTLEDEYNGRADALQTAMQAKLWDTGLQHFMHMARDDNPTEALLTSRELMGFVPWMFNMPQASDIVAFEQLTDPQGFAANYGPTTLERRSQLFMYEASNCCRWDGPSWPYETAQTLTAVENVLNDYPPQQHINASDYITLLQQYAATQFKNGQPYVAEAHDSDTDSWIYDTEDHSEDYNHSTFVDNVIAGLIGLRAQPNDTVIVNPLAPSSWDHFALENVAYHGHNVTILWDSSGSSYSQGQGLQVYVDGQLRGNRTTIGSLTVNVGPVVSQTINPLVNIVANGQQSPLGATPFASFTYQTDNVWNAVDGIIWRTGIPENTRWTSYSSSNAEDSFGVDFQHPQAVSEVRLYFYDDNDGVRLPASFDLQYWTGSAWTSIPNQQVDASSSTSNALTTVTFPTVVTSQLQVVAPNSGSGIGWGLSEFEVWAPAIFELQNKNSAKLMGVEDESKANNATIQQYEDNGTPDHLWQFIRTTGGWYKIMNQNSGLLLSVQDASTADSAALQQSKDSGEDNQLWRVESQESGLFLIRNKNSGLVVGVDGESTDDSANVVQYQDNGTDDHLWSILPAVPANTTIN
ncbi:hypothetical protein PISL3812_01848 [Talaromyces islandicus]|uniref:Uncharacterized protein n=1 Tax=Talaromyces islandicus TaxID=28573 RepID=A0A0U1LN92_TALIS|nr:hypothetical protein PISL3812_01848 [Talaromyces islandicus]